jgi:uncharacterized protein (DUF302 family)
MYGFTKKIDTDYEDAIERVREALMDEGFGVLTEIDVKATLKAKLDVDFRRYMILGACNPPFAHNALSAELDIGLLMPCNVIVYENDGGGSTVGMIDASMMATATGNDSLGPLADDVNAKLKKVLASL